MKPPEPDDPLSRTLSHWQLAPPRSPEFRGAVRTRMKGAEHGASWTGYVRTHAPLVVGTLALAVLLGAVTGREQARARVVAESNQLATSYVQALDARNMRMP